jgi:hypothetical protein
LYKIAAPSAAAAVGFVRTTIAAVTLPSLIRLWGRSAQRTGSLFCYAGLKQPADLRDGVDLTSVAHAASLQRGAGDYSAARGIGQEDHQIS